MRPSLWSYPRYVAFRDEVSSFAELGGYAARTMTLTELGSPEILAVIAYLQSLGGTPTVTMETTLTDLGVE